ncbi:MAG: glutaredoxin family protein [Candidatus Pacearchaeota archaeon]
MKVIVYSTSTCPYCDMAKEFLRKNKIKFLDIDVNENKNAARDMIKKSGQTGVPVIEIDNQIVIGFNKQKLKELLKLK